MSFPFPSAPNGGPMKEPPNLMAQRLAAIRAKPVLYALGALCVPLGVACFCAMMLLHSALLCAAAEAAWGWAQYLRFLVFDYARTVHSSGGLRMDARAQLYDSLVRFHIPCQLGLLSIRLLVAKAVSNKMAHTSARKARWVAGLNALYAAVVWGLHRPIVARAELFRSQHEEPADASTPTALFLSLYAHSFWFAALSLVSIVWVPTSASKLREAEHDLLRKHAASSGSGERTLDAQMKQHRAGHLSYIVLQHERDHADPGSEDAAEPVAATVPPSVSGQLSNVVAPPFHGTALVFLHGYGAGKAFWFLNLPSISASLPQARIYACDLMGMGASGLHEDAQSMRHCRDSQDAEEYFVQSLEGWRVRVGLQRMILVGHSFGGYISGCYAMRYPHRVAHLILASPVGLPVPEPLDVVSPASRAPAWIQRYGLVKVLRWLWTRHVTLSEILHFLGPLGSVLFKSIVRRRFAHLDAAQPKTLKDGSVSPRGIDIWSMAEYLYAINSGACPGHRGLSLLLIPGAYAVDPLVPRLSKHLRTHTSLLYGSDDWMDHAAGEEVVACIQARPEEPNSPGSQVEAECITIPHAGHQLYLENPREFNATVVRIVQKCQNREKMDKACCEQGNSSSSNGNCSGSSSGSGSNKKKKQAAASSSSGSRSTNVASAAVRHRASKPASGAQ